MGWRFAIAAIAVVATYSCQESAPQAASTGGVPLEDAAQLAPPDAPAVSVPTDIHSPDTGARPPAPSDSSAPALDAGAALDEPGVSPDVCFEAGAACDDGDPCTTTDRCKMLAGELACAGAALEVDDGNPCTADSCLDGAAKYVFLDGHVCIPTIGCGEGGLCKAGACAPDVPCACESDADCTDQADVCLGVSTCDKSGDVPVCVLVPGTAVVCPIAPSSCHISDCEPETGACSLIPLLEGTPCDDNSLCTFETKCNSVGACLGPEVYCDDGKACTQDYCDPEYGCKHKSYGCCGDGEIDDTEECDDGNSDDEDGCNHNCQVESPFPPYAPKFSIATFDVSADGALIATGTHLLAGLDKIFAECYAPDQSVVRPKFVLFQTGEGLAAKRAHAARAAATGLTAVALSHHTSPFGTSDYVKSRRLIYRLLDADCQPMTDPILLSEASAHPVWDISIDSVGGAAVVWSETTPCLGCAGATQRSLLALFDEQGTSLGPHEVLDPEACPGGVVHVATNQSTGGLIVTCQGGIADPVVYGRFDAYGVPIDAAPVVVAGTEGASCDGNCHLVAVRDDGVFIVVWFDAAAMEFEANLYGPDGALIQHVVLGEMLWGNNFDVFGSTHIELQLTDGDFIVPWSKNGDYGMLMMARVSAKGELLFAGSVPHGVTKLRIDGSGGTYVHAWNQKAILKDVVSVQIPAAPVP